MSILCPSSYIPSKISHSDSIIQINLQNTSQELLSVYKQNVPYDMVIKWGSNQFHVHFFVIQQHSDIFWKGLVKKQDDLFIFNLKFDQTKPNIQIEAQKQIIQKIIDSLYGQTLIIQRGSVQKAFKICKQLHLTQLLDYFHTDIILNFQDYQIFPLLKFANHQKIIDVISLCYERLETQQFQQLRYNRSGILVFQLDLFRTIIKRHNFIKHQKMGDQFGLSYWEIKSLIQEYCLIHGINKKRKQKISQQIFNNGNLSNLIMSKSTKKKIFSCAKIVSMTSLGDIKQPQQEQSIYKKKKSVKSRAIKCVSFVDDYSFGHGILEEEEQKTHRIKHKKSLQQRYVNHDNSLSNVSTYSQPNNKKLIKSTRSQLNSIQDKETILKIQLVQQNLIDSLKSSTQIQKKASILFNSLKRNIKKSRQRTSKIQKMENQLDQIYAQIVTGKERLVEVERVVNDIQQRKSIQESIQKRRIKNIFQTSIALQLTVSTQFGTRKIKRPC